MGDLCTKVGERETRQKSISIPPKAGELASLQVTPNIIICLFFFVLFQTVFDPRVC